jgi:protein-S-isoprenylcysteine O-methyltransferase Ste14
MAVESGAQIGLEEKVRRAVTWYRVPLMAIGMAALAAFMHDARAFWYGAPVAVLGELIQMWAGSQLHKDQHLTISGPYSHVRNPMYIGRFVLGLGFFVMTRSPYLIAGYAIVFAAYAHMRVQREESRLKVIFEPDYQHYCSEIRRWLPRIKPYSRSESKNASWAQVCANHENINMLGVLVVLAAVYARIAAWPDWFLHF